MLPGQQTGTHIIAQEPTQPVSVARKVQTTVVMCQATEDNTILMRFSPPVTVCASLIASGSSGTFATAHSQNEAMSAARSTESFDSNKPDSMMGIRAAAARRRLISGVDGGIWLGIASF